MQDITFDTYDEFSKNPGISILDNYSIALRSKLSKLLNSLDEYQRYVVLNKDIDMPLQVVAASGSGKTQSLLAKALKMVIENRVYPEEIVLITFTNKAANEIRERYINFFKDIVSQDEISDIPLPHISTIHSFSCAILYKLFGIRRTIIDEGHSRNLLKSIISNILSMPKVEKKFVDNIHSVIDQIYSNNDVHYFGIPLFKRGGVFDKVTDSREIGKNPTQVYTLLEKFSLNSISKKLRGEDNSPGDIVDVYVDKSEMSYKNFYKVFNTFMEKKYQSNSMNFSDMQYITFCILNQDMNARNRVWDTHKYYVVDESQDIDVLEFSLMITCDQDSYTRYLKQV